MPARQTWDLTDFESGIDLRDGLYSDNQSRLRQGDNIMITKGRKIQRRPPCRQYAGDFDALSQGLVNIDGQDYTFARKGDTIAHTGDVAARVKTLYFDIPDLTTSWTLLNAGIFNGQAAAWILHTFPSATYPAIAVLHVWDGLLYAPTFVQDADLPGSFSPSIVDLDSQLYDPTFVPVFGLGVTKVWTSTLRGNSQACRTADARSWNQRTKDSFLQDGEYWVFLVPEGLGALRSYTVPRDATWMQVDGRWAYYVCEYNSGTAWVPMAEVAVTPIAPYTWRPVAVATRFPGGWAEVQVQVCWGRAGAGIVRLRMVAGATSVDVTETPSVGTAVSTGSAYKLAIGEAKFRFRGGDGVTTAAHSTADMAEGRTYLLAVTADAVAFPELVDITTGFPNGWEREHRRFIKKITTQASLAGTTVLNPAWRTNSVGAGTVTVPGGGFTVVGVGSNFTALLVVGGTITVAGSDRIIATITDDRHCTVTVVWGGTSTAVAWSAAFGYSAFVSTKTHVLVDSILQPSLVVGNTLRINGVDYLVEAISGPDITININGVDADYSGPTNQFYAIARTSVPTVVDYQYAFISNADSDWYTGILVEYIDLAGAEDALSLSTSSIDNTGGLITSISSIRQRMVITYPGSLQLWSIDQDTNKTAFLDQLSFGTGHQANPCPVIWYSEVLLPMLTGFRAIDAIGPNLNNLQDLNVGEPISDLPMITVRAANFWSWYGQVLIAGRRGSDFVFLCLDYSRESKITAWSQWIVAGVTDVDTGTIIADQGFLRFRSGTKLRYFDATADGVAVPFRDFADVAGNAYKSIAFFHFNDLGKPGAGKRWVNLDVVQDGVSTIDFALTPYGGRVASAPGAFVNGIRVEGLTYGRARIPMSLNAQGISPRVTSQDETGWRLQSLAIDFLLLRR